MNGNKKKTTAVESYGEGTHSERRRLIRFSHRRRFNYAVELLNAEPDSRVLDFGSGDGYLLERLLPRVHPENMVAFEPLDYLQVQIRERLAGVPVRLVSAPDDLTGLQFDRIACLEVLEHLQPETIRQTLGTLEKLLASDGILVISVPVEIGPTAVFKYLAEMILRRSNRHSSISEVIKAAFYRKLERDTNSSFIPHKGFDYRKLRAEISGRFRIERELFSPLPFFKGILNSQVLWQLKKPESTL